MDCYGVRTYGITTKTQQFQHISPVLHNLHWLPVTKRTEFKILTKNYKALNGMALSYICDLLQVHHPQPKPSFCIQGSVIGGYLIIIRHRLMVPLFLCSCTYSLKFLASKTFKTCKHFFSLQESSKHFYLPVFNYNLVSYIFLIFYVLHL